MSKPTYLTHPKRKENLSNEYLYKKTKKIRLNVKLAKISVFKQSWFSYL
jgi:hypothetical protein